MCISGESCNLTIYVSQARGNAILQASLERRKQALHERRVALEQDVCLIQLASICLLLCIQNISETICCVHICYILFCCNQL